MQAIRPAASIDRIVGPALDTSGMTQDSWTTRDLPVLRAVVELYDSTGHYLTHEGQQY